MIHDLQTASACGTGGLNTSCGNCLALHKPRFGEYRAELAASGGVYVWSAADIAMRDAVAQEVVEAQAQLAALQDVQEMVQEASDKPTPVLDKQVKDALVVVDDAMRKFMGELQLAEALADKYKDAAGRAARERRGVQGGPERAARQAQRAAGARRGPAGPVPRGRGHGQAPAGGGLCGGPVPRARQGRPGDRGGQASRLRRGHARKGHPPNSRGHGPGLAPRCRRTRTSCPRKSWRSTG